MVEVNQEVAPVEGALKFQILFVVVLVKVHLSLGVDESDKASLLPG